MLSRFTWILTRRLSLVLHSREDRVQVTTGTARFYACLGTFQDQRYPATTARRPRWSLPQLVDHLGGVSHGASW